MNETNELLTAAVADHRAGRFAQAEALYRDVVRRDQNCADAWHLLGMLAHQTGRNHLAVDFVERAIRLNAHCAAFHNTLGEANRGLNQLDSARVNFQNALDIEPNLAEARNNLGLVYLACNQLAVAASYFEQAIQLRSDFSAAQLNLRNVRLAQGLTRDTVTQSESALSVNPAELSGQNDVQIAAWPQESLGIAEARTATTGSAVTPLVNVQADRPRTADEWSAEEIADFERRAQLEPENAIAQYNLGVIRAAQHHPDAAIALYQRALQLQPGFVEALGNLGCVWKDCGDSAKAIDYYRQALQIRPDYYESLTNLGVALRGLGQLDESLSCFRRAVELRPDHADGFHGLGNVWNELGQLDDAIAAFRRTLQLNPDHGLARVSLAHVQQHACEWHGFAELEQRIIHSVETDPEAVVSPFTFLSFPRTTARLQLQCAEKVAARIVSNTRQLAVDFERVRNGQRSLQDRSDVIRIGYLSADFRDHAVANLCAEWFERHDRQQFAVHGYSIGPDDGSTLRRRIVAACDRFVDLTLHSYFEAARAIAADQVDILVDLMGYTKHSRQQILALRPAPIQVQYLGFPGTMGAPFIDYTLVDEFVVPRSQQPFFSEQLVHLPGCYQVNPTTRQLSTDIPSRRECGLPETGFVFCCFNNNYKITPMIFGLWTEILELTPGSVLWLFEGNRFAVRNLRREAAAMGISSDRLIFASPQPLDVYIARHRLADLFLDTFPYNAHATASHSLWMGCPLLTMSGETFASRVSGSLLQTLGVPEFIVNSPDEYRTMAVRLAKNPELLRALKARLQTNCKSSALFDSDRFARNVETAYSQMWKLFMAGDSPRPITIGRESSAAPE